jgi:hypothetical protein
MTIQCFTSFSFNYLGKARVLAHSLKRHHPDWQLAACITDRPPPGFTLDLAVEDFDRVIWAHDLPIDNIMGWLFSHDVIEACTAVKGPVLRQLIEEGHDKILYFDPDIAVLGPLDPLVDWLNHYSVLLTPHQLAPDDELQAIIDNEVCSLIHGIYNLGFLAVRNDDNGRAFAQWWDKRLRDFCHDDKARGLFVDQKWCDHVPAMFDGVKIIRDPGYNVASWNLSRRRLSITPSGDILVNGVPLRFYHFTKLGPVGDTMTRRYAKDNTEVYELWSWYRRKVDAFTDPAIPGSFWHYAIFENGRMISKDARTLYRHRVDLRAAFLDPFQTQHHSYFDWLKSEEPSLLTT